MRYRVKTPLMAVKRDDAPTPGSGFSFVTLHTGSLISIHGTVLNSGLIEILHEDQIVAAFLSDIEERAERVEEKTSLMSNGHLS